jgi:hypothetical protein
MEPGIATAVREVVTMVINVLLIRAEKTQTVAETLTKQQAPIAEIVWSAIVMVIVTTSAEEM